MGLFVFIMYFSGGLIPTYLNNGGIDMDCTKYASDVLSTQLTLMLSSEELTDLVLCGNTGIGNINDWGTEGYFLLIDEYLDYMPNLKALFEENPDYRAGVTAPDGHIYGLSY